MQRSRIVVLTEGRGIEIPAHVMAEAGLKPGDRFLLYTEAGVVHLRKVDESATPPAGPPSHGDREEFLGFVEEWFLTHLKGFEKRMTFQGDLASMHLSEILLFLSMTKKTGVLILRRARVTKKLYYQDGEIVFAQSSVPEERLGDILLASGRITEEQYRESAARIAPGRRQGRVLVEMGVIAPEELRRLVCGQVEAVIYSLFLWDAGYFEFLEGDLPGEERITLRRSIPDLILEGMRRAGPAAGRPDLRAGEDPVLHRLEGEAEAFGEVTLTPEEKSVLAAVSSGMSISEVCRRSPLPGDESRAVLFRLLAAGLLRASRPRGGAAAAALPEDSEGLVRRIEQCNMIFRLIAEHVRSRVGDRVYVILGAFFRGISHGQEILFENVTLEPDGSLDPRPLLVNLSEYPPEERESILVRGLNELLYFQLFAVRNNLGPDQEKQVIAALREMSFLS